VGWELGILEHDLAQTFQRVQDRYQVLYDDPDRLYFKKFSVVYHSDNFFVRVHKLKDNVYTLVGKMMGVEREYRERAFFKQVFERLEARKLHAVAKCLHTFETDKALKEALRQRNFFVHRYRREPDWPMLDAGQRFYETGEYGIR